ncbi:hypothetical protein EVAR_9607_1 [Eumeta japonica]|uniref:Uncharacterized protein n=1 Tax=Eumeta variegata TaxID=151549 RepID=A0A4C1TMU1_EUMVA|nr:hypothetical protein EVAR_9607_1 [Eumeta japonica]
MAIRRVNLQKFDIATAHPIPKDMKQYIIQQLYHYDYEQVEPKFFSYPPPRQEFKVKSYEEAYRKYMKSRTTSFNDKTTSVAPPVTRSTE